MRAIKTRLVEATECRPIRITARTGKLSTTITWDDSESHEENHCRAARKLCEMCSWKQPTIAGQLSGNEFGHVFIPPGKMIVDKLEYELLKL